MPATERAVFLDRDGTLIVEKDYLADPDHVEFVPGVFTALRTLKAAGYKLVIVTNQSGIARGIYSIEDYRAVERRIEELLRAQGIALDAVYYCPHHPDFSGPCDCRKPLLGMYRQAERNLSIDLSRSVYIGDRLKDVLPALETGGRAILVRTGYGEAEREKRPPGVEVADDLPAAARQLVGETRTAP